MLRRTRLSAAILAVLLSSFTVQAQATKETDTWMPFQFLIGNWSGVGSGNPAEAVAGATSFSFELDKRIILRKNRAEYLPKTARKAPVVHEDLMVIYPEATNSKFRAVYFDNEGHVINYTVSAPVNRSALLFESAESNQGMRFRLVYELTAQGTLATEFYTAPPGGDYKLYVRGVLKKD